MGDLQTHYNSSLRVSVKPHQSSFFAGEEFLCTITFTNANPKVAHTQPLPQTATFPTSTFQSDPDFKSGIDYLTLEPSFPGRRIVSSAPFHNAHAKSKSVDLRALLNQASTNSQADGSGNKPSRGKTLLRQLDGEIIPQRKGLIGTQTGTNRTPSAVTQWPFQSNGARAATRAHHSKSASVSVTMPADRPGLGLGFPSAPSRPGPSQGKGVFDASPSTSDRTSDPYASTDNTPTKSRGPSANFGRKSSAMISSKHPHSRKKSVAQTQAEDLTEAFELDADARSGSGPSTSIGSQVDLNRSERSPWASGEFYKLGKNDTMESVVRDSITDWSQDVRNQGGLNPSGSSPIYPSVDLIAPGSEKILWSFAQLGGTAEIDESLVKPGDFETLKRRLAYGDVPGSASSAGSMPGTPRTIGGGDLGHSGDSDGDGRVGWGGYFRNALGAGAAGRLSSRHRRTGSTLEDTRDRTLHSRSVPTFSTPPSILAVDLNLGPGESKSYTFRIGLPVDLPPSYHGKAIRFHYNLSIGTNKRDPTARSRQGQKSRLIQIPIRIYNHVTTTGARPFYDLMNPIIMLREQALVEAENVEVEPVQSKHRLKRKTSASKYKPDSRGITKRSDLEQYAREQLKVAANSAGEESEGNTEASAASVDPFGAESRSQETCKSAVEILSRSSTKVSYDISKDGKVAAVLTLVKSKYRLGDTIMGVISINERGSLARIARVAATLETFEEVQPSIALLPSGRMQRSTKVVHTEYHESTLDKGRASFSLPIPSGATPDFVTSGVKLNWTVRLSFLTIASTKPLVLDPSSAAAAPPRQPPPQHLVPASSDGFSLYHLSLRAVPSLAGPLPSFSNAQSRQPVQETKLETVECAVPVVVLPNSTGFSVGAAEFYA